MTSKDYIAAAALLAIGMIGGALIVDVPYEPRIADLERNVELLKYPPPPPTNEPDYGHITASREIPSNLSVESLEAEPCCVAGKVTIIDAEVTVETEVRDGTVIPTGRYLVKMNTTSDVPTVFSDIQALHKRLRGQGQPVIVEP